MSPQELQTLQNFLDQLVQVRGVSQEPQAAAMINSAVARQPDAPYLLVQRALLMEQALNAANSQIASLQAELSEQKALNGNKPAASIFDSGANAWGNSAASRPAAVNAPEMARSVTGNPLPAYPASAGYVAPAPAAPMMAAPGSGSSWLGGGAGSMLGSVATAAAGVAAGAFLYQGISHLMNGGSHNVFGSANNLSPDSAASLSNNAAADANLDPGYFARSENPPVDSNTSYLSSADASFDSGLDDSSYSGDGSDLI